MIKVGKPLTTRVVKDSLGRRLVGGTTWFWVILFLEAVASSHFTISAFADKLSHGFQQAGDWLIEGCCSVCSRSSA